MGWFSKPRDEGTSAVAEAAAGSNPLDSLSGPEDKALETLASVSRIFGQYAIEIDEPSQADFPQRCSAWEMHLLRNDPPPVGEALPGPVEPGRAPKHKAFADFLRFFTQRRTVEQDFMMDSLGELRDVLLGLVSRLRSSAKIENQATDEMARELEVLSAAAENLSITELRAQVRQSVEVIGQVLDGQRSRRQAQLDELSQSLVQTKTALVKARGQARRDALTGLDNRHVLDEELAQRVLLAEASQVPLSAIMVDLDHFKRVNDTHGHAGGDEVLKAAAGALVRNFLRKDDLVCRYGGEEFCVLLHNTDTKDALRLTNRLLERFRRLEIEGPKGTIRVTGSAGVATLSPDETGEALLKRADEALYEAKRTGRDRAVSAK